MLDYNRQDCEALQTVANMVVDLYSAAPSSDRTTGTEVLRTSDIKRECPFGFRRNEFVFPELEAINKVQQTRIRTRGRTIGEVAREIARVIFLDVYTPADIETTLRTFAEGT